MPTGSLRPWTWHVDETPEASHVDSVRDEPAAISFGRGEQKQFRRRWDRCFRVSDDRWDPASPGKYTISTGLSVPNANEHGLYAETTVTLA